MGSREKVNDADPQPRSAAATPPTGRASLLAAEGVGKTFGVTKVLRDVKIDVRAGEIRGLVGQNGSGKSTLVKILAGVHAPDPGARMWLGDREVTFPVATRWLTSAGVAVMHQEPGLVADMSVLDNFLMNGCSRATAPDPVAKGGASGCRGA